MKTFKIIGLAFMAALTGASFSACTSETEELLGQDTEIRLTSLITSPSRGTDLNQQATQIVVGQQVGVTITGAKSAHDNIAWTAGNNGTLTNTGEALFYGSGSATITAYHPYNSAWKGINSNVPFGVFTDQSNEGYLKSEAGEIAGFRYGQGTGGTWAGENGGFIDEYGYNFSMRDGFGRPNGALLRLYDNVFNFGNGEGHFRFFQADSSGGGSNVNSIGIQTGGYRNTILKYNNLGQEVAEVLWSDNESIYTNDRVTFSTSVSPPALMQDGDLFFVYEN